MLIPIASESGYRLFGTFNYGQPLMVADYSSDSNAGIRSISTVEFDLEKYQISSSGDESIHTLLSASSDLGGFGRNLLQPHSYMIPIMNGPHDVIRTQKSNSGVIWPTSSISVYAKHAASSNGGATIDSYFGSNDTAMNPIYQISYLEKSNTLIANIDKPIHLYDDVGDSGYILIPDNLDKDIKNNLDFYLAKTGLKTDIHIDKHPPKGT